MLSEESQRRGTPRDQKVTFSISKYRHFTHSSDYKGLVIGRDFIGGLVSHTFRLRNSNRDPLILPSTSRAYPEGYVAINIKEMNDIKKLHKYLPEDPVVQAFYDTVFNTPTINSEENDADE